MMEQTKREEPKSLHDSGLGSFGSESDTSPIQNTADPPTTVTGAELGEVPKQTIIMSATQSLTTFYVSYLGESVLDRRYTQPMLPWVMAEVRRRKDRCPIKLEVLSHNLKASLTEGGDEVFSHKLQSLSRFARTHQDPKCFAYLNRVNTESPFTCHVFEAKEEGHVPELFTAIREATKVAVKDYSLHAGIRKERSIDLLGDLPAPGTNVSLFEILYVGKVTVSEKKAPPTFIDEAVSKFHISDEKNAMVEEKRKRHASGSSVHSLPTNLESAVSIRENELEGQSVKAGGQDNRSDGSINGEHSDANSNVEHGNTGGRSDLSGNNNILGRGDTGSADLSQDSLRGSDSSMSSQSEEDRVGPLRGGGDSIPKAGSKGNVRRNRTMLIQIGQHEVCLISPDRKSIILERKFKDISFCSQGIQQAEHFGFISRDPASGQFLCYVFRCANEPVVEEIMKVLKQAFHNAFQQSAKNHIVCELCPMHQLHKLCQELEGGTPIKQYEILKSRIDQLNDQDGAEIMNRLVEENPQTPQEVNEVLMYLLRHMCETKQQNHTHISDSNRSHIKPEFILVDSSKNKTSKFDLKKAKRSLATSFENLIRGKTRRDEARDAFKDRTWTTTDSEASNCRSFDSSATETPETTPCSSPIVKEFRETLPRTPERDELAVRVGRPRSSTLPELPKMSSFSPKHTDFKDQKPTPLKLQGDSPLKTMFIRANNNNSVHYDRPSPFGSPSLTGDLMSPHTPRSQRQMSWRMGILNRVVTPARIPSKSPAPDDQGTEVPFRHKLSKQAIRALWRKAILETLLLIRMEKENISLQARQDAVETKRIKLDYEEITPCLKEVTKIWDGMLIAPNRAAVKFDQEKLLDAVKAGVPRNRRGDIWQLLVEQHRHHHPGLAKRHSMVADVYTPYEDLLKQLTTHQHAILIDLGRTFPTHPYFARQLGAGQLSLFNLLKAYSLVDKEVGYCQGLSFVAGILLMHIQEEKAFDMLKYMMFQLGFRRQYRPDMVALQIQMYQLSRLLHDNYRELYEHFEQHEIAPTLYAAPWFLTMFASQFPLGFVARVFDLIFLQGMEVVFKVALVLLGNHRELIMQCESFENIVEFLKCTLPELGIIQMERVINQVFTLDISQQLHAYEVEYHVLQEEMVSTPDHRDVDATSKLQEANRNLKRQNMELLEQLQAAHSHAHSMEVSMNQMTGAQNKLKSHVKTLELERAALLNSVAKLRRLIPKDVLEASDIQLPSVGEDGTPVVSPIHNPIVDRLVESNLLSTGPKVGSLTELDHEVARLTKSPKNRRKHSRDRLNINREQDRPSSTQNF